MTPFSQLSRRGLLKLGGTMALLSSWTVNATTSAALVAGIEPIPANSVKFLWFFDPEVGSSTIPKCTTQALNVKDERASEWRCLRASKSVDHAAGITRWSDFLIVRSYLEERGMRLQELQARGPMFYWMLTRRIA
jgi:hypothetical protein